jgi:hypothetical protein
MGDTETCQHALYRSPEIDEVINDQDFKMLQLVRRRSNWAFVQICHW